MKLVINICLNLILVGKLDGEGFCNTFKDEICKLTKGVMVVCKGKKYSSPYHLKARPSKDILNIVKIDITKL